MNSPENYRDKATETLKFILNRGKFYREKLHTFLEELGLHLPTLAEIGTLSFDVQYGPEIVALSSFDPYTFIATESSNHPFTWSVIRALQKFAPQNLAVLQGCPEKLTKQISRLAEPASLGIITWTNIFTQGNEPQRLTNFLSTYAPLLHPQGIIITSSHEEGRLATTGSVQKMFQQASQTSLEGLNLDYYQLQKPNLLGHFFLTAQNIFD